MTIALPLLICLVGLIVYMLPVANGKITEVARLSFAVGLLVVLLTADRLAKLF